MKKYLTAAFALILVLVCLLVLPLEARATERTVVDSGAWGENLTWILYDDGELVISGTGAMPENSGIPWSSYSDSISAATIQSGVTTIGPSAFELCNSLRRITLPNSVTTIDASAFAYCPLITITIPRSVTKIGAFAFSYCSSLGRIRFDGDAPVIGSTAFQSVTAVAEYPGNLASWTEEVRRNYGGSITWAAYVTQPEEPTVEWTQATTSLEGNIGLNFYVQLNDVLVNDPSTAMRFVLNGETIDQYTFKVDGEEAEPKPNGDLYFVEIPNIAAQDLDAMHTVTVGGLTVKYGGLSYVNQVIKNQASQSEQLANTAKALFAYNKLAENYFN